MTKKLIAGGVVHKLPSDLKTALSSAPAAQTAWLDITPLARNEWICWIESAQKPVTRNRPELKGRHKTLQPANDGLVAGPAAYTARHSLMIK